MKIKATFYILVDSYVKSAAEFEDNTKKVRWALWEVPWFPTEPNAASETTPNKNWNNSKSCLFLCKIYCKIRKKPVQFSFRTVGSSIRLFREPLPQGIFWVFFWFYGRFYVYVRIGKKEKCCFSFYFGLSLEIHSTLWEATGPLKGLEEFFESFFWTLRQTVRVYKNRQERKIWFQFPSWLMWSPFRLFQEPWSLLKGLGNFLSIRFILCWKRCEFLTCDDSTKTHILTQKFKKVFFRYQGPRVQLQYLNILFLLPL